MNCIIIEDQPPAQRLLKKYIDDIGILELKATFSDAIQAITYLKSAPVDLIFLDIHLPKISGLDFLKALANPPAVILTTAFAEYALVSYEYNVVDYLLKPFSFQRFVQAVSKIPKKEPGNQHTEKMHPVHQDIFIKSGYEHIRINPAEIICIQSDADYTDIILSEKKHLSSEPLRFWLEKLPPGQFMQIHRSCIINTDKIEKISGNRVYLTSKKIVPIGRKYKTDFAEKFLK